MFIAEHEIKDINGRAIVV